jgi:hypothetical protein
VDWDVNMLATKLANAVEGCPSGHQRIIIAGILHDALRPAAQPFAVELRALLEKFPFAALKVGVEMPQGANAPSYAVMVNADWIVCNTLELAMRHFIPDWQPAEPVAARTMDVDRAAEAIAQILCTDEEGFTGGRLVVVPPTAQAWKDGVGLDESEVQDRIAATLREVQEGETKV